MQALIIDTNVWIAYFREPDYAHKTSLEAALREGQVRLTPVIRLELLSGTRTEGEYKLLEDYLFNIPLLDITDELWNAAARTRFQCARKGHQIAIPDLLIAQTAAHHHCSLWSQDRAFEIIQKVLRFKLFKPS